jgi:hypothetical protein
MSLQILKIDEVTTGPTVYQSKESTIYNITNIYIYTNSRFQKTRKLEADFVRVEKGNS